MKTLIYQINIGKGTQWEADKLTNIINKYCIPSVKNYAKKNYLILIFLNNFY